jgi:hypothetical protein
MITQIRSLILPYPHADETRIEIIADIVPHNSVDFSTEHLREKTAIIWAIEEVGAAGAPGPLNCWVELSPFPNSVATAFWAAIGGGGGPSWPAVPALAPIAPTTEVGIGVNGVVHTIMLRWLNYSPYSRIRVQTPIAGAAGSVWAVQVWFMAGG